MADADKPESDKSDKKKNPPRPERAVPSRHTMMAGPHPLPYTATAGTLNLKDDKGEDRASVFYVSYVLDGVEDASTRPVTFCFNGGPGSSSVWLQLGAFGPRRVDMPDTLTCPPPPYRMVDNEHGLLELTDLVFIDPVGTGFSRAAGEADAKDFHGVKEDVESVGEFITRWISRNNRWNSAKYLAGESYGTTRAGGLSLYLHERGVFVNGLVLVSVALNFQTFIFEAGNDLPYALYLPSYAATAWYHDRLPVRPHNRDLWLREVREFALAEYMPALLRGAALDPALRARLAQKLASYTGLDAAEIERRNLRIPYLWFCRQLLGAGPRTVGRLDARYVGDDLDPYGQDLQRDPSYDAALGPYTGLINDHLRRSLGWISDEPYEVLSGKVHEGWKWAHGKRMGYVNMTDDLRQALIANPHLRVLMANGLYDLATPFFAAEYTADHLGVEPQLQKNVSLTYYEAGHMMYFHPPSLAQLKADLTAFYQHRPDVAGVEKS